MKLSDLVRYLNLLESPELDPAYDSITSALGSITDTVSNHSLQIESFTTDLNNDLNDIKSTIDKFDNTLQLLKKKIQEEIIKQEPAYYQESTRLFQQDMIYESVDYILNRRLKLEFDVEDTLRSKIKNNGDWRVPGMIIRPGKENFIEDMVPLDPLYLIDTTTELLEPALNGFTPEYRRRLRPYVVNEYTHEPILKQLPDNQFGFIFAYYYFNFKPVEVVEKWLQELYQKLRPGGSVVFTYNECDVATGVGAAEQSWMCYTPGKKIQSIIDNIGYETVDNYVGAYDVAWFEIRKPGTITSIRGGQALAKIVPK